MSPLARLLLLLLAAYRRAISPLLGQHCRFAPSCSAYAVTAVQRFGALRGGWLAVRRLLRCHPFHPGGHDPVPLARPIRSGAAVRPLTGSPLPSPRPPAVAAAVPIDVPIDVPALTPERTGAPSC